MANYTSFQKIMLINAVPAKFWLNLAGGILGMVFLWDQNLIAAVILGVPLMALGTLISKFSFHYDPGQIAKTFLGRIFLCYSQGLGLILYLASHIIIPLSFWLQSIWGVLFGVLLLAAGLLPSWKKYFG